MQNFRSVFSSSAVRETACRRLFQSGSCLQIKVGDKLPSIDLYDGAPDKKFNTSQLAKGKVVIVGVPGAFTPTCSNDHLPGVVNSANEIKKKGVSQIICVGVNDPYVMSAWSKTLDPSGKVKFLADTKGAFAKALDVAFDLTAALGNVRNKRYILVAENGVVKAVNVEPDGVGLACTKAQDVLKFL